MHIHIAFAGKEIEPTFSAVNALPCPKDHIILLYGRSKDKKYEQTAEMLRDKLGGGNITCRIIPVDGFDFTSVIDTIYDCYEEYIGKDKSTTMSIDITAGTNLMAAAACTAAFYTNSQVFYMLDGRVLKDMSPSELLIPVPSPKIPNVRKIRDDTMDVLRYIGEKDREGQYLINAELASHFGITPQGMGYHIRRLVDAGLIEYDNSVKGSDSRKKPLRIKREGRFILRAH